ncbi:MAG TPA: glycosyltransferase family 39 protein [Gammaproteobacteria bacterium]|nr:glycosyltransferase family 39 protein [Gammaproteobacteria bacterium]
MMRNLMDRIKLPSFSFSFTTSPNELAMWQIIFLGVLVFVGCFYGMGSYAILDMNEGLYAEVAREMLVNNHWLIPHLNGVEYLEKPPMLYWLMAISYKIFGINAFGARFIPSLATALTTLSFYFLGKKVGAARTGWIAAIVMLSSLVFLIIGRTVFFDPLFMFFISACLLSFYFSELYLAYAFLALAVLTKGVVVLILVPLILIVYLGLMGADKEQFRALLDRRAIILFLIIALPWHVLASLWEPRFIWEYIINQQFLRFFNMSTPHDYHTGPLYFYIPRVLAYLAPWSLFLAFMFWPLRLKKPFDSLKAFLWSWFAVMFVFFSLSADKGDYYLIIGTPPLAYLIAQKIEEWVVADKAKWLSLVYALLLSVMVAAGVYALLSPGLIPPLYRSSVSFLVVMVIGFAVGGMYLCYRNRNNPLIPVLLFALLSVPCVSFYLNIKQASQYLYSQKALAQFVKNEYQARSVYLYQDFEGFSSFVFYAGFPCPVVDSHSSDLHYGSTLKSGKDEFLTLNDFFAKSKTQFLYLVMHTNDVSGFEQLPDAKPFCAVAQNKRVVLLSNSPEDCQAAVLSGDQKKFPDEIRH